MSWFKTYIFCTSVLTYKCAITQQYNCMFFDNCIYVNLTHTFKNAEIIKITENSNIEYILEK